MKEKILFLVRGAAIAALYAVLTYALQPISYGVIQFRVSEALTLLPFLMPEAVWGLTLGCLIANILGGSIADMIFGTLATLLAAVLTRKIRKMWLAPVPVILCNAIIVGLMLSFTMYDLEQVTLGLCFANILAIAASETINTYAGGVPILLLTAKLGLHKSH